MKAILLALPRAQAAVQLKKVLVSASLPVTGTYGSGAEVLTAASALPDGVVVCGRLPDLSPAQLAQMLPSGFDLVELLSSGQIPLQGYSNVISLHLPLNRLEFVSTVQTLASASGVCFGSHGEQGRSSGEKELVFRAKALLMRELSLSEPEAYRLLQKRSMASGLRMADTARHVLRYGAKSLRKEVLR